MSEVTDSDFCHVQFNMGSMQAALPQVGDPLSGLTSQWGPSFQPTAAPGNVSSNVVLPAVVDVGVSYFLVSYFILFGMDAGGAYGYGMQSANLHQ